MPNPQLPEQFGQFPRVDLSAFYEQEGPRSIGGLTLQLGDGGVFGQPWRQDPPIDLSGHTQSTGGLEDSNYTIRQGRDSLLSQDQEPRLDTSLTPYDVGVDLSDIKSATTAYDVSPDRKEIEIDTVSLSMSRIRDLLEARYPAEAFPDINRIITSGTLLMRSVDGRNISAIKARGTDRDDSSGIGNMYGEAQIARRLSLKARDVTYVDARKLGQSFDDIDEVAFRIRPYYLVYDPRYLQKVGGTGGALSVFTASPDRALLGILHSTHPDAGNFQLP